MDWTLQQILLSFPSLPFSFVFVLLSFYSFTVNNNIWQTASLGMIYQPQHVGSEALLLTR